MKPLIPGTDWQPLIDALNSASGILLMTHRSPDSDGIGSQLAIYHALKSAGKNVRIHNFDPVPRICRYLEGSGEIGHGADFVCPPDIDTIVSVDCGARQRLGMEDAFFSGKRLINIDHHASNRMFGDINVVDAGYCATGAMVYDLLLAMNVALSPAMASAIYVALLTDTASFRLSTVTADVFRVAAVLVEAGAEPDVAAKAVYASNTYSRLELLKLSLESLRLHDDNHSAWLFVDDEMYRKSEADSEDTEGFIDYGRSIEGVLITVFIRQESDMCWKVSFRGAKGIDVGSLASELGGGGHRYAAGCTLTGTLKEVREKVRPLVTRYIAG